MSTLLVFGERCHDTAAEYHVYCQTCQLTLVFWELSLCVQFASRSSPTHRYLGSRAWKTREVVEAGACQLAVSFGTVVVVKTPIPSLDAR